MNTLSKVSLFIFLTLLVTAGFAQNKGGKTRQVQKKANTGKEQKADALPPSQPKQDTAPADQNTSGSASGLTKYPQEIQKILKNEDAILRGYDFGTPKQKIKETEDAEYVADGKDFMIYNVKISDKENAEIIYYMDAEDKVRGFGVAFFVNPGTLAQNMEATLVDDFQNYYNEKYGKFQVNDKNDEYWVAKDGSYTIEMGDSSEDVNTIEVEIEIFKK